MQTFIFVLGSLLQNTERVGCARSRHRSGQVNHANKFVGRLHGVGVTGVLFGRRQREDFRLSIESISSVLARTFVIVVRALLFSLVDCPSFQA